MATTLRLSSGLELGGGKMPQEMVGGEVLASNEKNSKHVPSHKMPKIGKEGKLKR
jgi:hypothetical protein